MLDADPLIHTEELSRNQKIEITSANYAGRNWISNPSRIGRSGGIPIFFNRGRNFEMTLGSLKLCSNYPKGRQAVQNLHTTKKRESEKITYADDKDRP